MELAAELLGARFKNPVLLAAGTCGFGEEIQGVVDLGLLGGLVTKSVTLEPRRGNPAPRVTEFRAGMLNSVGLANPGARAVLAEKLPWIRDHLDGLPVLVSVAGHRVEEYWEVVETLEPGPGFVGFELNLSCPNDARRNGLPFALDPDALLRVVSGARERTRRPLLVKLAPNTADWGPVVHAAEEAGASALTLVNTLPGLLLDPRNRRPLLGAGAGGVSGPALRALGVYAVWTVARMTRLPILGVGGISSGEDAAEYLLAGASLVQIGTASFWDPRAPARVVDELRRFGISQGVHRVSELVGAALPPPEPEMSDPAGTRDGMGASGGDSGVIHG
ncbi:MAG: dihydroorotate dehydrogenase [Gemmatimonadetes bacterium]|nr:dihydroorotate dehydrogenase [Gemmatimonadota bacterium]